MALTKISTAMISQSAAAVDLNVDAGTFYVDTTNNRVGVGGKTDPDTPLHVIGTVTATLFAGSGASLTSIPNSALTNSSITINSTATSLGGSITLGTDDVAEGSSNLYYTDARADARIAAADTDDLSEGSSNLYYTDARVDARVSGGSLGNITTTGYIRGPSSFTIDPAAHGDNTGTVVIAGNLQVDGVTTTINSTTLTVDDKNITLASGSANAAAASGAGFTVDIGSGTLPAITYDGTNDEWDFNKPLNVTGSVGVTNIVTNKVVKFNGTVLDDSMITDNGTSVGIDQPSPSSTYKLDVSGAIRSATAAPSFALQETDASNQTWLMGSYGGTFAIRDVTGGTYPVYVEAATPSSTLYLDSTGNVGIGTTPVTHYTGYEALDIGNTLSLMSNNTSTNISTLTNNGYLNSNASNWVRKVADESTMYEQVSGQHRFKTAASGSAGGAITWSEKMRIDASGNVGIGNTNPQHKIHFGEGGGYYTSIGSGNSVPGGATPWLGVFNNTSIASATYGWGFYDSSADGSLQIWNKDSSTTGAVALTIKRGGNVGIGTDSPGRKLHLKDGQIKFQNTGSGGWAGLDFSMGNGTYDGYMGMLDSDGKFFIDVDSNGNDFVILQNGNVGINQSNPSHKLQVSVDAKGAFIKRDISSNAANLSEFNSNRSLLLLNRNSGSYLAFGGNGSRTDIQATDLAGTPTAKNIALNPFGGNVGIGTDSPAAPLHVKHASGEAKVIIQAGSNTSSAVLQFGDSVDTSRGGIEYTSTDDMAFSTNNMTEAMRIRYTGNVGIGTSSPIEKLDVSGYQGISVNANYAHMGSTVSGAMAIFGHNIKSDSANNTIKTANTGYHSSMIKMYYNEGITFHATSGTQSAGAAFYDISGTTNELMRITNAGNVGIGTGNPQAKLHVTSSVLIEGGSTDSRTLGFTNASGSTGWSIGNGIIDSTHNFRIYDNTAGAARVTVDGNGNVGIGVTSIPSWANLMTNGTVAVGGTLYMKTGNPIQALSAFPGGASDLKMQTGGGKVTIGGPGGSTTGHLELYGRYSGSDPTLSFRTDHPTAGNNTVWNMARITADDGGNYNGVLHFQVAAGNGSANNGAALATAMTIQDTKYVGIGTTVPNAPLTVWTASSATSQSALRLNNPGGFSSANAGCEIIFSQDRSTSEDYRMAAISSSQQYSGSSAGGELKFWTRGSSSITEKARLHANGVLAASAGIALGSGLANTAANTLDDYEEGTWTPTITGYAQATPHSQTYSVQTGNYTKVGNLVTAHFFVTLSNKGNIASASGNYAFITGLPFTHGGSVAGIGVMWGWQALNTAVSMVAADISSTNTQAWLTHLPATSGAGTSYMGTSQITNTTSFRGTLIYKSS